MFYPTICILNYTDAYILQNICVSQYLIKSGSIVFLISFLCLPYEVIYLLSSVFNITAINIYIFCDPLSLQKSITLNIITCIKLDNSSTNDLGDSFTHFTSCKIHLFKERDKTPSR